MEEARNIGLAEKPTGETLPFEGFFQEEHARLFGTLCLMTGNATEAEDLIQEALRLLLKRLKAVR